MGLFKKKQKNVLQSIELNGVKIIINKDTNVIIYQKGDTVLRTEVRRDLVKAISEIIEVSKELSPAEEKELVILNEVQELADKAVTEELSEEEK